MNIVFRVDASVRIGTGHVMRCLTLAQRLQEYKVNILFVCRELEGHLCELIEDKGFPVRRLPRMKPENKPANWVEHAEWLTVPWETDASQTRELITGQFCQVDWLIVDHYALDYRWELKLLEDVGSLMVIDDLADRKHQCDILLDQNYYSDMYIRYRDLVPSGCRFHLGPSHALLRKEFYEKKRQLRLRDGNIRKVMVFMGGSDFSNETDKVLEAIRLSGLEEIRFDMIVGASNPNRLSIREQCAGMKNVRYLGQVHDMAKVMADADLAIGCGGSTTWERCFMGLPSLTIVAAQNQIRIAREVENYGAAWNLGMKENVTAHNIALCLKKAVNNTKSLLHMQKKALELVDETDKTILLKDLMGDGNG